MNWEDYQCGTEGTWSEVFSFVTPRVDQSWSPKVAVFGDMGLENMQALKVLAPAAARGEIDSLLHTGDIAYDLNGENGQVGDKYMNKIQSLVAHLPYMVCPGNQEVAKYAFRFQIYWALFIRIYI